MDEMARIHRLQALVGRSQDVLKSIFLEALGAVEADEGFLAFEDASGYLSILVSRGSFWHLPKDEGVAGRVFASGKETIVDPSRSAEFKATEGSTYSEMIIPIRQGEQSVGVLLFDNHKHISFQRIPHLNTALGYAEKMQEVLEQREPWAFREWWIGYQNRKKAKLIDAVERSLKTATVAMKDVDVTVGFLTDDGRLSGERRISKGTRPITERETSLEQVLHYGDSVFVDEPVTKFECVVPFPSSGPILGAVLMETYRRDALSEEVQRAVEQLVKQVSFDHLEPAATTGSPEYEFFFRLVHTAFRCRHFHESLEDSLSALASQACEVCDAQVRIAYFSGNLKAGDDSEELPVYEITSEEIKRKFSGDIGRRPRCKILEGWLRVPVFDALRVSAVVEIQSRTPIDDSFNISLAENLGVLTAVVLREWRDQ